MSKKSNLLDELGKGLGLSFLGLLVSFFYKMYSHSLLFALVCLILIFVIFKKIKDKRKYFSSKNTLESLRSLTPDEFEEYITDLFRRLGFKTEKVGGSHDGGIDVVVKKNNLKSYIQCKKFITREVTVHDVRDFYGAITGAFVKAKSYFITTNKFTLEAEKFCEDKPIELIDGQRLMQYIDKVGETPIIRSNIICPQCGGQLVERSGKYGQFFGCSNYPKCIYTKK
jgi:restriction system protein